MVWFNLMFVRIKQCKFENVFRVKRKLIIFKKNGHVVKFNWFFIKPHKIMDYQKKKKNYLSKYDVAVKVF